MRALIATAVLTLTGPALADTGRRSLLDVPSPQTQPEGRIAGAVDELIHPTPHYGRRDASQLVVGVRSARDFENHTDTSLFAQRTWFVVDDVEIGVEAAAWWIFQTDDTWGISSSLVTRYHFYHGERTSYFVEGGIGLFLAADNVPDNGTAFGFMPRIGAGTAIRLNDTDTRLLLGLHWHHISNARLNGEARNPSRDGVALYAALSVPF